MLTHKNIYLFCQRNDLKRGIRNTALKNRFCAILSCTCLYLFNRVIWQRADWLSCVPELSDGPSRKITIRIMPILLIPIPLHKETQFWAILILKPN